MALCESVDKIELEIQLTARGEVALGRWQLALELDVCNWDDRNADAKHLVKELGVEAPPWESLAPPWAL